MIFSGARLNLLNFSQKKILTSNGCKPIGDLKATRYFETAPPPTHRLLAGRFSASWKQLYDSTPTAAAGTRWKGVDTLKNHAHKTFGPVRIIYNDQATCYLIHSQFRSIFDQLSRKLTNCSKLNFKPFYAHRSFDPQKFPCFQRII